MTDQKKQYGRGILAYREAHDTLTEAGYTDFEIRTAFLTDHLPKPVVLRDALHNTHPKSGSSADYGRAIVVGSVAALMATGLDFEVAWGIVRLNLPEGYDVTCIPPSWMISKSSEATMA